MEPQKDVAAPTTVQEGSKDEVEVKGKGKGKDERGGVDMQDFIKAEFLLPNPNKGKAKGKDSEEKDKDKKKVRGVNRARPFARIARSTQLCFSVKDGRPCARLERGDKCDYIHDEMAYLESKPADIPLECPHYTIHGACPYGVMCRAAKMHLKISESGPQLLEDEEKQKTVGPYKEMNVSDGAFYSALRKHEVEFPISDAYFKKKKEEEGKMEVVADAQADEKEKEDEGSSASEQPAAKKLKTDGATATTDVSDVVFTDVGAPDDDPESRKKKVDFRNKLMLAPMATLGNVPYRRICKRFGADITCGEMAFSRELLYANKREWAQLKRHPEEDVFGMQITGFNVGDVARVSELFATHKDKYNIDYLDLNAGCPLDLVTDAGAGSALLDKPKKLADMVSVMKSISGLPVIVKLRMGKNANSIVAHKLIPRLEQSGASAFIVHGRTRQQRYAKRADWDYIGRCAAATSLPVLGNGDIFDWEEAMKRYEEHKVSGLVLARGALIKPWLFTEIKERRRWDISATERLDVLKDFARFGLLHWGSDENGVSNIRRYMLDWMGYLCKYVPVGLLERFPQPLAARGAWFRGRNDLETLLSSWDVADWVKIVNMILGPPPEGFVYQAKQKAQGSYYS